MRLVLNIFTFFREGFVGLNLPREKLGPSLRAPKNCFEPPEIIFSTHDDLFSRRCSLFLWDKERDELVAKVFDGEIPSNGDNGKVCVYNYVTTNHFRVFSIGRELIFKTELVVCMRLMVTTL